MKDFKFRYYLCYYSYLCFFYSFWGYFLILIILHLFGMEMNAYLGYIFFLLFGLWAGSATALSATSYMKKIYREELEKKQNSKDS
ncbi:hypothetical protein [Bacteroides acidifaciens]|uniref:hypothetical protein n=1 Tax=Bacteroides acidifaciens TaxID=85831 RepID=UPI00158BE296|nr:hypothetical protein [Bacteroides acidifaciens]